MAVSGSQEGRCALVWQCSGSLLPAGPAAKLLLAQQRQSSDSSWHPALPGVCGLRTARPPARPPAHLQCRQALLALQLLPAQLPAVGASLPRRRLQALLPRLHGSTQGGRAAGGAGLGDCAGISSCQAGVGMWVQVLLGLPPGTRRGWQPAGASRGGGGSRWRGRGLKSAGGDHWGCEGGGDGWLGGGG